MYFCCTRNDKLTAYEVCGDGRHAMNKNDLGDIRYSIDHGKHILYAERHDNITKPGIYAEWEAMQQLDGFDPAYDTLVDYSHVSKVELDYPDLNELNNDMPRLDPRTGNIAIVSGLKQRHYYLARFFCLIANTITSRKHQVFKNRNDAESWLLGMRKSGQY